MKTFDELTSFFKSNTIETFHIARDPKKAVAKEGKWFKGEGCFLTWINVRDDKFYVKFKTNADKKEIAFLVSSEGAFYIQKVGAKILETPIWLDVTTNV